MGLKFMPEVKHMFNYGPNEEHLGGVLQRNLFIFILWC